MDDASILLVIWHSRTNASEQMARAAAAHENAQIMRARDVRTEHILKAAGYLFVCPENLASMSGEMKEMFDANYYPVLGKIEGRPYASIIAAGSDGSGAQRQMDRIATGWRLKRVADPMIVNFDAQTPEDILAIKSVEERILEDCRELGLSMGEGIALGVF
ncbi:flavodoxin family protein [Erythrobacter sp. SCSIO 43205]|uniref:flavodoxin family protein n=1 Tax=Erythrobacter sp. SCSIO 43205 TaxID=2779361 RepID=UPI001CA928BC|nr:flavodoxin family protein [Erythrobacter sp. SCSIO 43205]UAB77049.1 flavodoxin family protein [Erythrobacter sp. SCSIO 43205]